MSPSENADAVIQLYLDQGYLTSRAILANQTITDGVVQLQVIEGRLESVQIVWARLTQPRP
ncbi:MAG: POTRA domain-containing protein [Cyanobacteria bacterium P01_H01_bin.119]